MNCVQCNTPGPAFEICDGLCLRCMAKKASRWEQQAQAYREALVQIRDSCQATGVTYEEQSFRVTEMAKRALDRVVE